MNTITHLSQFNIFNTTTPSNGLTAFLFGQTKKMQNFKYLIMFLLIFCQVRLRGVKTRSVITRISNEELDNLKGSPEIDLGDKDDSVLYFVYNRTSKDIKSGRNSPPDYQKVTGHVSIKT